MLNCKPLNDFIRYLHRSHPFTIDKDPFCLAFTDQGIIYYTCKAVLSGRENLADILYPCLHLQGISLHCRFAVFDMVGFGYPGAAQYQTGLVSEVDGFRMACRRINHPA